jgi:hypothetical protein
MGRGYVTVAIRRTMGYPMKGYVPMSVRKPMSAMQNKPIANSSINQNRYQEEKAYVEKLKNNFFLKHKLTEKYLQKLEDEAQLNPWSEESGERAVILRGLTNGGEDTEKLPLNEKFYKIINRIEGRPAWNRLIHLSEKEKEQFANYFFENKEKANPIMDRYTGKKRTVKYDDFETIELGPSGTSPYPGGWDAIQHSYFPKKFAKKVDKINEFGENLWENASNKIRETAYDKNLNEYDGKENTYEVLNIIRKKYPLITKFEHNGIDGIIAKTPDKSQIIPTVNESYKLTTKINEILKNEWNDYKKERGLRFYNELSNTEKNVLRSTR